MKPQKKWGMKLKHYPIEKSRWARFLEITRQLGLPWEKVPPFEEDARYFVQMHLRDHSMFEEAYYNPVFLKLGRVEKKLDKVLEMMGTLGILVKGD